MSENKKEKPGFFARASKWLSALPARITEAFKSMVAELKKVAWPTRQDLINYSLVVIGFVVVLAVVVGVLDLASSAVVQRLIAL